MRTLMIVLLATSCCSAQFPLQPAYNFSGSTSGTATVPMNTAATWVALGFVQPSAKTLTKIRVYVSAVNGVVAASDQRLELAADLGANPTATITVSTATSRITLPSHGFAANDLVRVATNGSGPTGLPLDTNLYVRSPTSNDFLVSTTPDDLNLITITNAGTGTNTIRKILAATATTTALPAANTWLEFTSLNGALAGNFQYWLLLRNRNGSPAVNYVTYRTTNPFIPNPVFGGGGYGWARKLSTDSGTSWPSASNLYGALGLRLEFSDGTFIGTPVSNLATVTTADRAYDNQEVGTGFTTPNNARMRISGCVIGASKNGTPQGNPRCRIYLGSTLVGTSNVFSRNLLTGVTLLVMMFSSPLDIPPGANVRIMLGTDSAGGDTSSNGYQPIELTLDNDANSKALTPFGGSVKWKRDTAGVWSSSDTSFINFGILLDPQQQFGVQAVQKAYAFTN